MAAACPTLAHGYQSLCLGWRPDVSRPNKFRILKPKARSDELPAMLGEHMMANAFLPMVEPGNLPTVTPLGGENIFPTCEFMVYFGRVVRDRSPPASDGAAFLSKTRPKSVGFYRSVEACLRKGCHPSRCSC